MKRNLLAALITIGIILLFIGFCWVILNFVQYAIYTICFIFMSALVYGIFEYVKLLLGGPK